MANFIGPCSGGMRTALHELGVGYLAAGHQPVLIIPGEDVSDEELSQGRVITLPGSVVPFFGGYRAFFTRHKIATLLEELKPDRLEVSDQTTLRWTGRWARRNGVPAVMVAHESMAGLLAIPANVTGLARWRSALLAMSARIVGDYLNRRSALDYKQIICTTKWAAREFERISAKNVTRIPLAVDLELFRPERRSDEIRNRYAAREQVLLVHCSRLSLEKKPHRSVLALAELRAAGIDAVLVVAGDGPMRPGMEQIAAERGLPVTFAGFIPDRMEVAALLASADVVIAPGPLETFGLAALEALACGTPVVASADSALPEVIGDAGVAAIGDDFAAGVISVLCWPAGERRARARARAEEFSWPAAIEAFLAVHEALEEEKVRA
jgi:alpha-1,6-mannosyltransferase